MRFYLHDGWTKEELESLMVKGKLHDPFPGDGDNGYYLLQVGGAFDIEKLTGKVSEIFHTFGDHKGKSIQDIVKHFNW